MDEDELRESRFKRVKATSEADLPALTILRPRRYLARYPDHGYAWYLLANALHRAGALRRGRGSHVQRAAALPRGEAHFPLCTMGHLDKSRGDYERAADWFRKAIEAAQRTPRATSIWVASLPFRGACAKRRRSTEGDRDLL